MANFLYNGLASGLTKFKIEDLTSGFRLFRTSAIRHYISLFPARFSYPTTSTIIMIKAGYSIKYVSLQFDVRQHGKSGIRIFSDGWKFLTIIFKIVVLFEPLRVFGPVSGITLFLGIVLTVYNMIVTGFFRITNSGVILLTGSVLFLLLGLISEQIAALQLSLGALAGKQENKADE